MDCGTLPLHAHSTGPACSSVWVWLYLYDIQIFGHPFICNLCWGGRIGHIKFSVFCTIRLLAASLMGPVPRLLGHDGTVQVHPVAVK